MHELVFPNPYLVEWSLSRRDSVAGRMQHVQGVIDHDITLAEHGLETASCLQRSGQTSSTEEAICVLHFPGTSSSVRILIVRVRLKPNFNRFSLVGRSYQLHHRTSCT
jgi:hypothetical protein